MQLKSFAAFSASILVSKREGVPFVSVLSEHPISENDKERIIVERIGLSLSIYLVLASIASP